MNAGCAGPSGESAAAIAEPGIAAAYIPLHARVDLGLADEAGAAVVIAPGIAATNAHNADLIDPKSVIGTATLSDLLFFRTGRRAVPVMGDPVAGEAVTAYGEAASGSLRIAHGTVLERVFVKGYAAPAWFTYSGNAGPGFSGGPVIDPQGRLVGITFAYDDRGPHRVILAYDMVRILAELSALGSGPGTKPN